MMRRRCSTRESGRESGSSIGREGASARPVFDPESGPSENCVSVDPAALIPRADKFAGDAQQTAASAGHRDKFTNGAQRGALSYSHHSSEQQIQDKKFTQRKERGHVHPKQGNSQLSDEASSTAGEEPSRRVKSVVQVPNKSSNTTEQHRNRWRYDRSDREDVPRRQHKMRGKRHYMDPGKFDGSTCVRTFVMTFNNCARYNQWGDDDKEAHLRNCLTGNAAQLVWETEGYNFEELIDKLESRYGSSGQEEMYQGLLRNRRRKRNESMQELAQDIRRLMILAYPGEVTRLHRIIGKDAFLRALNDEELEVKVREHETSTIGDALRVAERFEVIKNSVSNRDGGPRNVRATQENQDESWRRKVESRLDELGKLLIKVEKQIDKNTNELVANHSGDGVQRYRMERRQRDEHFYGRCFKCGKPGHMAADCRLKHQEDKSKTVTQTGTPPHTHIIANVNGRSMYCLLDSGSEVSIINSLDVKDCDIRFRDTEIKAANGTDIPIRGVTTLFMQIRGRKIVSEVYVSDHIKGLILGVDWLRNNNIKWNFRRAEIRIGQRMVPLITPPQHHHSVRRIYIRENVTLPPRSMLDIVTDVQVTSLPRIGTDEHWYSQATAVKEGVYVANTLIESNKLKDVRVRLLNVNNKEVCLEDGMTISELEPVMMETNKNEKSTLTSKIDKFAQIKEKFLRELDGSLNERLIAQIESVLNNYQDVFCVEDEEMGRTNVVRHHIDTAEARPIKQQLRRYPPLYRKVIKIMWTRCWTKE